MAYLELTYPEYHMNRKITFYLYHHAHMKMFQFYICGAVALLFKVNFILMHCLSDESIPLPKGRVALRGNTVPGYNISRYAMISRCHLVCGCTHPLS
jgi:hypothetical protein